MPAIPDRWENYNPVGEKIEGTRFIAFKVPLKELISSRVESEKRLDDKILLEKIPNLGLIIDLTNTNRYYNPTVFRNEGIKHTKLMIPGKRIPPKDRTDIFIKIVKDFVDENKDNDKLIGVHCTHGVNRTGYLICHYMISQMTIEPKEAMDKFANARGYKIERTNYIEDLQELPKKKQQNWREREQRDVYRNNWREKHENYINNYHDFNRGPRRSRDYSAGRHNSYKNSGSDSRSPHSKKSYYHNNNRGNNTFSYSRPSGSINESSNYNDPPAERYLDHHCAMSYRPPRLASDYYHTSTRPAFETQRTNYNLFSNPHRKDDL